MTRGDIETYRGDYTAYVKQREERWERRDKEFLTVQERFLKELDYVKRNIARASTTDQAKGRMRRLVRGVKAVELGGPQALNGSWLQFTEEVAISREKWNVAEVERHIKDLPSANPSHQRVKLGLQARVRGGKIVLRTQDLRVGYPSAPLFEAQDIVLLRGERVALVGANGTGKSTFLRTLLGEVEALGGSISLGVNVRVSYFSQAYEVLDPDHNVLDEFLAHRDMLIGQARDYLARYLFQGEDVFKPVQALSGGERSRLALAILSLQEGNFLLLDEPTNHLDIPSCEVLQEALQQFGGTILLVSHDRYLIDKLATQVWELRDGRMHVHQGDYGSFLIARQDAQRVGAAAGPRDNGRHRATRQRVGVQRLEPAEDAAHVEVLVDEVESVLARLSRDLAAATEARRWERVCSLTHEYESAQAQLDGLMARWEAAAR
jgi:ATP-binding cassette subfamily F protein 3